MYNYIEKTNPLFATLNIRSNKPAVFQSQTMRAREYGGDGCIGLRVEISSSVVCVNAIHTSGKVLKTSLFNFADCSEIYGDRV